MNDVKRMMNPPEDVCNKITLAQKRVSGVQSSVYPYVIQDLSKNSLKGMCKRAPRQETISHSNLCLQIENYFCLESFFSSTPWMCSRIDITQL